MTTRAAYTLFPATELSAPHDGPVFPIGGRTEWRAEIRVAKVTSVTVEIQVSGYGTSDADFTTVHSATITTKGTTKLSPDEFDGSVSAEDRLIRAAVTANTDPYVVQVVARAPFFTTTDGEPLRLLSKQVRELEATDRDRLIERAEAIVLGHALDQDDAGRLDANLLAGDALLRMQQAIALQIEHERKRDENMADQEASASFTDGDPRMPLLADGVTEALGPLQAHAGVTVWRGRG